MYFIKRMDDSRGPAIHAWEYRFHLKGVILSNLSDSGGENPAFFLSFLRVARPAIRRHNGSVHLHWCAEEVRIHQQNTGKKGFKLKLRSKKNSRHLKWSIKLTSQIHQDSGTLSIFISESHGKITVSVQLATTKHILSTVYPVYHT